MLSFYANPVFYLPDGPKNLNALAAFAGVNFGLIDQYSVELRDENDVALLRTPVIEMGCCCDADKVRVFFLNGLGALSDAVNFNPPRVVHKTESSEFKKALTYPLAKTDTGIERFNVRSNEIWECSTSCYSEDDMPWLMEIADTPRAFMQWQGTQGQGDDYLPVRILDAEFTQKKNENQFVYQFSITFKMANDNIIQRN